MICNICCFIKEFKKKKRYVVERQTHCPDTHDSSTKNFMNICCITFITFSAATKKEMKVEKIIKINDGLTK